MADYTPSHNGMQDLLTSLGMLQKANESSAERENQSKLLRQKYTQESQAKDEDIKRLQAMKDQGLVEEGGSATVDKVSTGSDPYAKQFQRQQQNEISQGQKLYQEAKKQVEPIETQLNAISMMHQLIDNPNSVDQKQLGALGARLTEGKGQRLLQSLVQELGAPSSIAGDSAKAMNWISGQAQSGLTAQQKNAFRQNLFKHQSEIEQQLSDGKTQFGQAASLIAPSLTAERHQQAINAASGHSDNILKDLTKRRQDYEKSAGAQQPGPMPPQQSQPSGIMGFLGGLLGQKQQPQQATPQQQTGPSQGVQVPGFHPDNFLGK